MNSDEFVEPPFRIMPSRSRRVYEPLVAISIGVVLFAIGLWSEIGDQIGGGLMFVGVILVAVCGLWFVRECRYFDPRNEYWIEIGIDEFALVTPDATDRSAWGNLNPFEVRETRTRHRTKYGDRESVTYEAMAMYGNLGVKIPLYDFATALADDEAGRARSICAILNELRQNALSRLAGEPSQLFQVPAGLVVAPMPPPKRKPLVAPSSVVQR